MFNVYDVCATTKITKSAINSPVKYGITDPIYPVKFDPWTEAYGYCGSFTYSAKLSGDDLPITNLIKFDSETRTFSIFSDDYSKSS